MLASPDPLTTDVADWLQSLRDAGRTTFSKLGLPDRRNESWRFTNIRAITETAFAAPSDSVRLSADEVARFAIPDLDATTLVFVDGLYRPELSDPLPRESGVLATTLAQAIREHPRDVEPHLGRLTRDTDDGFTALSNAHTGAEDTGLFLHVAAGATLSRPIRLLFIAAGAGTPTESHPRHLIVAERGANATVLEHCVSLDPAAVYLTNSVTEIIAADDARVDHYFLEQDSESAFNVATLAMQLGERSDVRSHTVLLGGRIVRNNVMPTLAGPKAHCLINGLYVAHGRQHLDNAMRVRHAAPGCDSRQYYKGILNDESRGVFTGRIIVDKAGQQTDAIQTNRNMLLSDDARVNARPQLEIYADDVKCTHGCTTGRVDDEAVFYFRSRGLPEPVARAMLIYAFAAEGFDRMDLVPVRRLLAREMIRKLPKAQGLSIEV